MNKELNKMEAKILRDLVDNYVEKVNDTINMTRIYYKLNEIINSTRKNEKLL